MTKIAINGFGRIGRNVFRSLQKRKSEFNFDVVAINDLTDSATLAHLLKYDSIHGKFADEIQHDDTSITVNGDHIKVLSERDPSKLPWKELGCDIVLECTGFFRDRAKAGMHLEAGAKKVLISAPSSDPDLTMAFGVNSDAYDAASHDIISCASCTTNCLAPMAKVLLENFGIESGTMTTIHSYTNDQKILDLPHGDLRRARAAAMSSIPTSTGAAKAVRLVLPELAGKVDGTAIRIPTPNVSLVDFVCNVERDTDVDEVNRALENAANGELKGVLGYSDEPLVSTDYIGNPHSSIIDALSTFVINKRLVKVVTWYDNEMGFSNRMLDVSKLVASSL